MAEMTSRERVTTALRHETPDRVPIFTHGMDPKFIREFGGGDVYEAYRALDLDIFPIRSQAWCQGKPLLYSLRNEVSPELRLSGGTFGGWAGVDEFGRVWEKGSYVGGAVASEEDMERYVPSLRLEERTDPAEVRQVRERYPDRAFALQAHTGPFGLSMESVGQERFLLLLHDDRPFIEKLLDARTEWYMGIARYGQELGADVIFMGDDVAYKGAPFVSPSEFEALMLPRYRRICDAVDTPVIWHSDGDITALLEVAVKAGFAGVHPLEPAAGMDLGWVKRQYGDRLVLVGNVDVSHVLCQGDPELVRREVRRCMEQGKPRGGYILSDSNTLHEGCNAAAIVEMYRYAKETGAY